MYFEFAGVPGSGKSTLASALQEHLHSLNPPVLSREDAIRQCLKKRKDGPIRGMLKQFPSRIWQPFMGVQFALPEFVTISSRHLEFISFISKTLSESHLPPLMIESIWHTTVRTFSELALITNHTATPELVLMDEAFAQRCFTLFGYIEHSVPNNLIQKYAELAPISDHVFWIVTDPATCVERFMKRYESQPLPYDFELNKEELTENFKSGNRILGHLANVLRKRGAQVYQIDGNCELNQSIEMLCNIDFQISNHDLGK